MVAKIKSGKSLIGALNYNEQKVKTGKARLIAACLYPQQHDRLSFDDKLFRLVDLAERNQRVKTNTLHLSLNFDVGEKVGRDKLCEIADAYMAKIGFDTQPYLVYQHFDAGHDHIHVVTTNIAADGHRISLHNIGKLKSEPARKEIEVEFNLVQAETQCKSLHNQNGIKPLIYGRTDTKSSISNIVNYVTQNYKFTSLPEFNAVLLAFNVQADRGSKETVMYNKNGLRYWVLDKNGQKTGVPIKASAIYKKPTLKLLEERFKLNEFLRKPYRNELSGKIERVLQTARNRQDLQILLSQIGVAVILRENAEGRLYGLTFVDSKSKVVFNGSDLGKRYSAAAIESQITVNRNNTQQRSNQNTTEIKSVHNPEEKFEGGLLANLLSPIDHTEDQSIFKQERKKKRKRLKL